MRRRARLWLAVAITLLSALLALLLSSCDLPTPLPTPDMGTPSHTSTPSSTDIATEVPEAAPPASSVITLTVWTTETFSPTQGITSGLILMQEVAEFEATHPGVRIEFTRKKPYGKGGILDFLLGTEAVVPTLLPDLAFVDIDELGTAAQAGVVQPLDKLIAPDLIADLYGFARQACTFDGQLYGLQVNADLDHLAYHTGQVTVPPRSWPGVLGNPRPYIFPAGGQAGLVNDDFLVQYLAVRPWPSADSPTEPFLEAEAVTAVLQYYRDGMSQGVFPAKILDYHHTDECWSDFQAGEAALTQVSAHRYLAERDRFPDSDMAPIPAVNGAGAAIGRGWALTLVTADPTRQSPAVEFMTQLMSPEPLAAWNKAANYLPTRQAALATWDGQDSYTRFAEQQLQAAQPHPRLPNYAEVAAALQAAIEDVLTGSATPEEAAAQAIEQTQ